MAEARARMWRDAGRWRGIVDGREVAAGTRNGCVDALRAAAGASLMTIEVEPELVGVAEAADLLGWDKRRIFTYLGRGSFPAPVAALASGRVWRRADIEAFAAARAERDRERERGRTRGKD